TATRRCREASMSPYLPSQLWVVEVLAAGLVVVIVAGHAIAHRLTTVVARALAWTTLVVGTLGVEKLVAGEPPGVRMIALIGYALLVMKVIVVIEERSRGMKPLSFGAWLGFAGTWLGMKPRIFAATVSAESGGLPGAGKLIRRGALHAVIGSALVMLARISWTSGRSRLVASVLLLAGLSLVVHFGLCNLLAGAWRLRGVAC